MKFSLIASVFSIATVALAAPGVEKRTVVKGFDISDWQPSVNFAGAYKSGLRFAIIKATEGKDIIDSTVSEDFVPRRDSSNELVLFTLHRSNQRWIHSRRISLRSTNTVFRCSAGRVLLGAWRRLVRRWPHSSRHARSRSKSFGLVPHGGCQLDQRFRRHVLRQDKEISHTLFQPQLVGDLHWQLQCFFEDLPALPCCLGSVS